MEKPPCVIAGQPLNWCARSLNEEQEYGRIILPETWWKGWRIQQRRLIGPGGLIFTASGLAWIDRNVRRAALAGD